ncbi:replicase [water chestnut virus A]|uniref:Replication protein 1a n=1 Tax=water chestnut virus A TaxID=2884706 RepID=A0A8K1JZ69_9BROM|nr:replicase [water chestnut virus A]
MSSSSVSYAAISELLTDTLRRQCTDETTAVGRLFAEEAQRVVKSGFGTGQSVRPLKISFQLTAEQQALLKKNFPGRTIEFSNSSSSSHSFAAAHRLLETDFVYQCFGDENSTIIDLGGNYVSHLKQKRYNIHCCCPLLDVRDCARHTERLMSYHTFKSKHPEEANDVNFCENTFQTCPESADYAMAIHSTSDLPLGELCTALKEKKVKKFICTMMVDPEMLIRDRGVIEHFNVEWSVDRIADRIYFDFIDAPCLGYDHKFSILMEYLKICTVVVGDTAFRVERKQDFSGVMVIDITLCSGYKPGMPLHAGRSCAWFTKLKSKTVVHVADVNVTHPEYDVVAKRKILVDTKVLTRVSEAAFRQYKPNVDAPSAIQSISTMLSSATNHCIINGVTMIAGTPLRIEDYVPVATTIYARVKRLYDTIHKTLNSMDDLLKFSKERKSTAVTESLKTVVEKLGLNQVSFGDELDTSKMKSNADYNIPINLFSAFIGKMSKTPPVMINADEAFMTSDYMLSPLRAFLKAIGSIPDRIITEKDEAGRESDFLCYNSFIKQIRSLKGFISGHYTTTSPLLSDPEMFIPLEIVMELSSKRIGDVLTVKQLKKNIDEKINKSNADRIASQIENERKRREQEKALLQIAAWVQAHPDGKIPAGLGNTEFIPKLLETRTLETEVETVDKPVINPYADAINEAIEYLDSTSAIAKKRLESLGEHCQWKNRYFSTLWAGDDSRRVYIPSSNKWCGPTTESPGPKAQYERGMSKDGYVIMHWEDGKVSETCRKSLLNHNIILFDDSCVFSSAERILPSLKKALTMDCDFKVTIMDGVAGCGKTTQIKSMVDLNGENPDLILTSNRSSADELKATIKGSQLILNRYVRTSDSYLMANNPPKSKRILFDECFMQHAGCIYAAATLAQCAELIAYGDTEQIPFISRNDTMVLKRHKLDGTIVEQKLTYRCPIDATAALSHFLYKKKRPVKTKRAVMRSIQVIPINSVSQIEQDKNAVYVTHTQAEKMALKSSPGFSNLRVFTTHEVQGGTFDKVFFVRISRTSNHLYSGKHPLVGPCHALVALSRHKSEFKYFTTAFSDSDDILLKACNSVISASDDEISIYLHTLCEIEEIK